MFQHQLEQQNKSISKRIGDALTGWVPRKATVTRSERGGVWVRFATESAASPESWFVSTISGAPAGTSGWVFTLGGSKGLFVATGALKPRTLRTSAAAYTVTTAGTYEIPGTTVIHMGLQPGIAYSVRWAVSIVMGPQASGTNRAAPGVRIQHGGVTDDNFFVSSYIDATNSRQVVTWEWGGEYTADVNGEIRTTVLLRWNAGTFNALATRINTTVG